LTKKTLFNENLQFFRKKAKLTQKELAEKLNISVNTYITYERDSEAKYSTLIDVAKILGVSIDNLLTGENSAYEPVRRIKLITADNATDFERNLNAAVDDVGGNIIDIKFSAFPSLYTAILILEIPQ